MRHGSFGHVRGRLRNRPTSRRAGGHQGRAGPGAGGGVGLRGDDLAPQARARQAAARAVRAELRTPRPADRAAGAPARGTRGRGHGRCASGRGGGADDTGPRLRTAQTGAQAVSRTSAARARGGRGSHHLHLLRLVPDREDGRGHHRDARGDPPSVEGDPDGAREVHLPGLREDQPAAGAVPRHSARLGRSQPDRDGDLREVRPAPAAEPAQPSASRARASSSACPPWPISSAMPPSRWSRSMP